jgi:hypothetical protein
LLSSRSWGRSRRDSPQSPDERSTADLRGFELCRRSRLACGGSLRSRGLLRAHSVGLVRSNKPTGSRHAIVGDTVRHARTVSLAIVVSIAAVLSGCTEPVGQCPPDGKHNLNCHPSKSNASKNTDAGDGSAASDRDAAVTSSGDVSGGVTNTPDASIASAGSGGDQRNGIGGSDAPGDRGSAGGSASSADPAQTQAGTSGGPGAGSAMGGVSGGSTPTGTSSEYSLGVCPSSGSVRFIGRFESTPLPAVGAAPAQLLSVRCDGAMQPAMVFKAQFALTNQGESSTTVLCRLAGPSSRDEGRVTLSERASSIMTLEMASWMPMPSGDNTTSLTCSIESGASQVIADSIKLLVKIPASVTALAAP